ncbi:MAG TPA: hypothetical protein VFS43_40880 [Polyangiaceae bacterium]|nr:hypothetical protein [Polyangiaceae bacterium]
MTTETPAPPERPWRDLASAPGAPAWLAERLAREGEPAPARPPEPAPTSP